MRFSQGVDDNLTELDGPAVGLDDYRTDFPFEGVDGHGCQTVDGGFIDQLGAVEGDGNLAADQAHLESLPLFSRFTGVAFGSDAAVDGTAAVFGRRVAEIVHKLHLVAAAQGDAAVGPLPKQEFGMQIEV